MHSKNISYRPDIDGLRAIAIMLVLLYHFGLGVTGGFVGVDIFFVISGFLITEVIRNAVLKGTFSFVSFYDRRVRRLYPALVTVVLLSIGAAYLLMDPASYVVMANSVKSTLLSSSNVYFWKNQGYFDPAADTQVFLHTWSLSTEWQFYVVWPALIWAGMKAPKGVLIVALGALTIASLVASTMALSQNASAAYYLMPYRLFELSMGGLLALCFNYRSARTPNTLLFIGGLILIFASAFMLNSSAPFPGLLALIPCIGTALCIYSGHATPMSRLLKIKPVIYLGLISYSVYLVHWPLLVFYKYYISRPLELPEKLVLLALSIAVGSALYHTVERMFMGRTTLSKPFAFGVIAVSVLLTSLGARHIAKHDGLSTRINESQFSFIKPASKYHEFNYGGAGYKYEATLGNPVGKTIAVIAGDSYALQYASGIDAALEGKNETIQGVFRHGCVISSEYTRIVGGSPLKRCRDGYNRALALLQGNDTPLIWVQRWQGYQGVVADSKDRKVKNSGTDYPIFLEDMLKRMRVDIGDRPLILVGSQPAPPGTQSAAACLLRPNYLPKHCRRFLSFNLQQSSANTVNRTVKKFAENNPNTFYVDATHSFCTNDICKTATDDKILYSDNSHLSIDGSVMAVQQLLGEIQKHVDLRTTPLE